MLKLTTLQFLWLNSRGGRTVDDVVINDGHLCIKMSNRQQSFFRRIPNDKEILREYRVVTSIKPKYKEYHSNFELVLRGKY